MAMMIVVVVVVEIRHAIWGLKLLPTGAVFDDPNEPPKKCQELRFLKKAVFGLE